MFEGWREGWKASEAAGMTPGPDGSPGTPRPEADLVRWTGGLLFLASFLLFALHTPQGLASGDAAVYAQQVLTRDFASRPVHLGYYLLAAALSFFQQVPDRFFHLLSSGLSAGTLVLIWALARRHLSGDGRLALVAPLVLCSHSLFLENAAQAEIYAAQTFFVVLSLWLWLRGSAVLAGAGFGFAGLITPSTVFLAPLYLLWRRPEWRRLLPFALAAGATVALPLLPVAREYVYGDRGLLAATGKGMGPLAILVKEGFEFGLGFLAFLPLLALGLWRTARTPALRPFLAGLGAAWFATALFAERFKDVPSQLPVWTLGSLLAALGAAELVGLLASATSARQRLVFLAAGLAAVLPVLGLLVLRAQASSVARVLPGEIVAAAALVGLALILGYRRITSGQLRAAVWVLVVGALLATLFVASKIVREKNREIDAYLLEVRALGETAAPDYLAIGSWERGILLEHYLYRRSYTDHFLNVAWLEGGWGADRQESAMAEFELALREGREIWLLGKVPKVATRLEAVGYRFEETEGQARRAVKVLPGPSGPESAGKESAEWE